MIFKIRPFPHEYYLFLLQIKAVFLNLVYIFLWTSTFKPSGSLSSTGDKMYKNYLNKRKHGRLDSTDCLDSLSLFNQNLTLSSGQQREVKGFLPIGPSRQSSHKCLKSNVLQKNKSSSSTSPPTPLCSTCRYSTLLRCC